MSREQEVADLLVKSLSDDRERIKSEEKSHGACLCLMSRHGNENEWLFTDGYILKTKVRSAAKK